MRFVRQPVSLLSTLFAVALLASGQNSTITGTLTGQVIGSYSHMKMPNLAKTFNYMFVSVIPVLSDNYYKQARERLELLALTTVNNSQVFLAFALPFSMAPLCR